jgi:hypothetical protein
VKFGKDSNEYEISTIIRPCHRKRIRQVAGSEEKSNGEVGQRLRLFFIKQSVGFKKGESIMKKQIVCAAFLMGLAILHSGSASAAIDPDKAQKVLAEDGRSGDWLGQAVAISGDTAVIGARGDDSQTGSAYVFIRGEDGVWRQQAKLTADDRLANDRFGYSVAVSGDIAVVGALFDDRNDNDKDENFGAAYVFSRAEDGTWHQQAKLTTDDAASRDGFGCSVSVDKKTILVGANHKGNNWEGAAYVFSRDDDGVWRQQARLSDGTDQQAGDQARFGSSVSLSGDTALIGSFYDSTAGHLSGSAYAFVRGKDKLWRLQQKLIAEDAQPGDYFGSSVSVDEKTDTALIGAELDDDNGSGSGSAYVFVRDKKSGVWHQQAKLLAADGVALDFFGDSVSLSRDTALIGARTQTGDTGSAYVFVRDKDGNWQQQTKITSPDNAPGDYFGWSVSLSGSTALISVPGDDDKGTSSGSAWFY